MFAGDKPVLQARLKKPKKDAHQPVASFFVVIGLQRSAARHRPNIVSIPPTVIARCSTTLHDLHKALYRRDIRTATDQQSADDYMPASMRLRRARRSARSFARRLTSLGFS